MSQLHGKKMLSVTYAHTALMVEQEKVRSNLCSFRDFIQSVRRDFEYCERHNLEQLLERIKQLHLSCRWRRLEVHVLPEIRDATKNADLLLAELESLRLLGLDLYRSVRDQLRQALEGKTINMRDLYWAMELYCHTLQSLLMIEEKELFAVAMQTIPTEKWFLIAEKFMQQDKEALKFGQVGQGALSCHSDPTSSSFRLLIPGVQSPPSGLPRSDFHAVSSLLEEVENHPFLHSAIGPGKIAAQGVY